MSNGQFFALVLLAVSFGATTLWLAFRTCAAAESVAHTLETAHEAELAGMAEIFRKRQAAINRRNMRPIDLGAPPRHFARTAPPDNEWPPDAPRETNRDAGA